jgi:hypothetical protein
VEQQDVERIARAALKELGVFGAEVKITADDAHPGQWRIEIQGNRLSQLRIKCGQGTTAQWVRQQIFEQYLGQS